MIIIFLCQKIRLDIFYIKKQKTYTAYHGPLWYVPGLFRVCLTM
jgi:hypothetical protein